MKHTGSAQKLSVLVLDTESGFTTRELQVDIPDNNQENKGSKTVSVQRRHSSQPILTRSEQAWKKPDKLLFLFKQQFAKYANIPFVLNTSHSLKNNIITYEAQTISYKHKFGVVYCHSSQNRESEMYANRNESPGFKNFLAILGSMVQLKGFGGYNGGLDVEADATGTHSIIATYPTNKDDSPDCQIMFHVSTMIPYTNGDPQQIARKRHIGNDVSMIIFQDGIKSDEDHTIHFKSFRSQFNHIWIIVSDYGDQDDCYHIQVYVKDQIGAFPPEIPKGGIIRKDDTSGLRNWLLMKLINSERKAFRSSSFIGRFKYVRRFQLKHMIENTTDSQNLRKDEIAALQHKTPFNERQIKILFEEFKHIVAKDAAGIQLGAFKRLMKFVMPQLTDDDHLTHMFYVFDCDKDGVLSFHDLVIGLSILRTGSTEERLRFLFDAYDINNDGILSDNELLALFNSFYAILGTTGAESFVAPLIAESDLNSNGGITFEEFVNMAHSQPALLECFKIKSSASKTVYTNTADKKSRAEEEEEAEAKDGNLQNSRRPHKDPAHAKSLGALKLNRQFGRGSTLHLLPTPDKEAEPPHHHVSAVASSSPGSCPCWLW
eukprot:TRINITY_DN1278_c0_g2_i1.p1 TRINITY_DN1278_c0_g2~~TRINITY_DN1278_c0_g2_i1.p1  ORF type:complete len:642 (+),score=82.32 TRINITY_DN1278_c0_g2_i1:123-1928(+)